jgi:hypothetical protein
LLPIGPIPTLGVVDAIEQDWQVATSDNRCTKYEKHIGLLATIYAQYPVGVYDSSILRNNFWRQANGVLLLFVFPSTGIGKLVAWFTADSSLIASVVVEKKMVVVSAAINAVGTSHPIANQ